MQKIFAALLIVVFVLPVGASSSLVEPREEAIIYAGPGQTHYQVNRVQWQDDITIIERNPVGDWLYVHIERGNAGMEIEGWVQTGRMILDESVEFSEIPVNFEATHFDPENMDSRTEAELYAYPIVPTDISPAMREIFERGQAMGNHADVVTKVGDSVSSNAVFVGAMAEPEYELGPYDYLEDTVRFFGEGTDVPSVASQVGLSSIAVFDSIFASAEWCAPDETPLACEYRNRQPSIAVVLFGPNDVRSMDADRYAEQMTRIVEESLERGIIPVLLTFSVHPEDGLWWQSLDLNLAVAEVANEYEVPLINFWAASRILPDFGLEIDQIHLSPSGYRKLIYTTGHEAYYGLSYLNLLTVYTLDLLRRELAMDAPQ